MDATRVVFPTVLWPTTATLRSDGAERIFMAPDYIHGAVGDPFSSRPAGGRADRGGS